MNRHEGVGAPDVFVSQMLFQANLDMLEAFKKDESLVQRFVEVEEYQTKQYNQ